MKRFLILSIVLLVSCAPKEFQSTLDVLESRIEQAPDSVLSVVESIAPSKFASRKLKARHALLHTIALDKNYIDLKTDSIIAPAIKYYSRRGTANERFKTLYYHGRIFQNAGDTESALDRFIKASDLASEEVDSLALARCYAAQGILYFESCDYQKAAQADRNAADIFFAVGNTNSYVNRVLRESICWYSLNQMTRMKECLDEVEPYKSNISESALSSYYSRLLSYYVDTGNYKNVQGTLIEYLDRIPEHKVNWNVVFTAYGTIKDFDNMDIAIQKYAQYNKSRDVRYYALMSNYLESKELYKEAMDSYKEYIKAIDSSYTTTHVQNVRLIEEQYIKEKRILEQKINNLTLSIVIIVIAFLLIVSIVYAINRKKEAQNIKDLYLTLEQEKTSLEKMLESSVSLDDDVRWILAERMQLLNEIVLNHSLYSSGISNISKEKISMLLADTKEYLSTIGMTYVVKNPETVSFLRSRGLSTWEIGYCCLYVMGYSAKEIGGIMHNNQVYKISSEIRKKLGLEGGKVKLETYLKNLFACG